MIPHKVVGDNMACSYLGESYSEGEYVCQGKDKYVCFENRWLLSLKDAPECSVEVAGWNLLKTMTVTLNPSAEEVAGWNMLKTITVTLSPSVEEVAGWNLLKTIDITLTPSGIPSECRVDSDCPTGYKCVNGKCVKMEENGEEGDIPWPWIAAGAVGIGGIALLTGKGKTTGKKKT